MTFLALTQTTETTCSPIDYLPTELLIEIFVHCTTRTDPLAPLTLARVSSLWRQVVQSSPRIWRYIYLDDRSSIASSHAQARIWTRQSYPLNFDVHLDVSQSSRLVLPLLSPLLPLMNRWRYYSMSGKREESVDLSDSLPNYVDPLVIVIRDPDQLEIEDEGPEGLPRPTFTSAMPAWLTMNIWVSELPKAPALVPLRFTSIVMTESIPIQPRSVLEFLFACPQLEAFFFTGWQHDDEVLTSPLPIARLPNLRTLHVRSTCGTRSLLSSIDTPRLSELHLAHLNVDFTLAAPASPVDGDSDDEAGDFSRSASSDRATGMGLRALLLRSDPPLRVLDMDWSDMRTKDFRFAFARLGMLEHFFIEASDMSDKVIELLRPYVPSRGKGERVRVRLPRLKSLELSNCNELSGEALVGVLSERVRLTDGLAAWEGNTLNEVIISDCAGLKGDHGDLLRKELGNRLRLRD
ncbi:hypothetical protein C8F04DRAFT_1362286 [Mycena alexandri]|uniref:F-box domain-containing protein n=1 Tax=Mycena alexandri TaxID=1745969 RepID=A0AAD6TDN9_9AGAR|nr:hypothetical protein C8F04DRAFT_1362286 [Mycena alexandri]